MEQVKAPEKIYIPRLEGNETFVHEWSATKFRKYYSREIAENIEYVRTDAFIEKALDYIENNIYDHYDGDNEYGICGGYVKKEEFIKNFKKYMKG